MDSAGSESGEEQLMGEHESKPVGAPHPVTGSEG